MSGRVLILHMKFILLSLFCFFSQFLLAQQTGKISGYVTEKNIPLEFVTVTVAKMQDTANIVHYTITDTTGFFLFDKVEPGDYLIKFSLIGYKISGKKISLTAK